MRKYVRLIAVMISIILCSNLIVSAHSGREHNEQMEKVLFGGKANEEQKDAAKALAAAAYLTIDQFKGDGQNNLDLLEEYGVSGLPELSEIDISSTETGHHREYTHQGWDSKYRKIERSKNQGVDEEWSGKWEKRKKILQSTVEKIFRFSWWSNIPFIGNALPDYGEKCDSLCALIYYTHLLGDHEATKSMKQYSYLMPVGGKINNKDIINELLYHCNVLFEAQSDTYEFAMYTMKLEEINRKYYKLREVKSENISQNKKYAEEVLKIMYEYIPKMLSKEEFYSKLEEFSGAA